MNKKLLLSEISAEKLFNQKQLSKLKSYVEKYISSRIDYYKETNSNLRIESEFSEWWIKHILDGEIVSGGNYPIDVLTSINGRWVGIDVGCLCLNGKLSNEKSLIQNFTSAGNNLDNLFESGDVEQIKNIYITKFLEKIKQDDLDFINEFYYVIFVSTKTKIRIVILRLNLDLLSRITKIIKVGTVMNKSIRINGMIGEGNGDVKIYKSKKRMELRLNKKIIERSTTIFQL